jgi:hypothetical protein
VGIAADEDVNPLSIERGLEDLVDRARFGAQLMGHADAPAVDVQHLFLRHARVIKDIVVSLGDEHRRELCAPLDDGWRGDIARMEDEVDAAEDVGDLRAEFIERADE